MCFVALLSNTMGGVKGLNQYKKTRNRARKLKGAKKIVKALTDGSLKIDGVSFTGKMNGQLVHWACETINRNRETLGASWETEGKVPTHLLWNGDRYPQATVLGLCVYASILPIIALRAATICKGSEVKHIKIALDHLPHCSERGTRLLNALLDNDQNLREMWSQNQKYGHSFELGVFESYIDNDGNRRSGKKHPNSILVDWLAASCMAKVNPDQLKEEGGFDEAEVAEIAKIWDTLKIHGSSCLRNFDDPELIRMVKEHAAKQDAS